MPSEVRVCLRACLTTRASTLTRWTHRAALLRAPKQRAFGADDDDADDADDDDDDSDGHDAPPAGARGPDVFG